MSKRISLKEFKRQALKEGYMVGLKELRKKKSLAESMGKKEMLFDDRELPDSGARWNVELQLGEITKPNMVRVQVPFVDFASTPDDNPLLGYMQRNAEMVYEERLEEGEDNFYMVYSGRYICEDFVDFIADSLDIDDSDYAFGGCFNGGYYNDAISTCSILLNPTVAGAIGVSGKNSKKDYETLMAYVADIIGCDPNEQEIFDVYFDRGYGNETIANSGEDVGY